MIFCILRMIVQKISGNRIVFSVKRFNADRRNGGEGFVIVEALCQKIESMGFDRMLFLGERCLKYKHFIRLHRFFLFIHSRERNHET